MENYYQKEIETASPEQIRQWQDERLVKTVKHVWDNVEFYRNRMIEAGVTPEDIHGVEDLHKLPFVTKDDLRDNYPYGLLATDLKNCVRIHSTSGTTGKRVVAFYTQHDVDLWEDCTARSIVAAGGTEEDVVLSRLQVLKEEGYLRRIGTFFDSNKLGYHGTLVALRVEPDKLSEVAGVINGYPGATHNYEREGRYNLWFTLLTPDEKQEKNIISEVTSLPGVEDVLNLKAHKKYKINVQFKLQ